MKPLSSTRGPALFGVLALTLMLSLSLSPQPGPRVASTGAIEPAGSEGAPIWGVTGSIGGGLGRDGRTEQACCPLLRPQIGSTFPVTFVENGLPPGGSWGIALSDGQSANSTGLEVEFNLANGSYNFTSRTNGTGYIGSPLNGTIQVAGAPVQQYVVFFEFSYIALFPETGLPPGTLWTVNVTGESSFVSTASSLSVTEPNGSYSFVAASSGSGYRSVAGNFTIRGSGVTIPVTFQHVYFVVFNESGLPYGVRWSVSLNKTLETSALTSLAFTLVNGSYAYSIGNVTGFHPVSSGIGTIRVEGSDVFVPVQFDTGTGNMSIPGQPVD